MTDRRSVQEKVDAIRADLAALRVAMDSSLTFMNDSVAELIKDNAEPTEEDPWPPPPVKVGDRVKVKGCWYPVVDLGEDRIFVGDGYLVPSIDKITDVYTAEEFARNSALVQVQLLPTHGRCGALSAVYADTGQTDRVIIPEIGTGVLVFLTLEATAALGEFHPVPDRPIVAGDCVRGISEVWLAKHPEYIVGPVSHVAREDAAFIAPVIKDEPISKDIREALSQLEVGEVFEQRHLMIKAENGGWRTAPGGLSGGAYYRMKPGEPSTDDACQDCDQQYPSKCEVCAEPSTDDRPCNCGDPRSAIGTCQRHPITVRQTRYDTDDRPWTSLPLITAGDGRSYGPDLCAPGGGRRWFLVPNPDGYDPYTDDEIAALGPVREAVIVTLPDRLPGHCVTVNDRAFPIRISDHVGGFTTTEGARSLAAELLAAARAAEQAGGADHE